MGKNDLINALAVTAEICNARWTDAAKAVILGELQTYPEPAVMAALVRCRQECKTLSLADILCRIEDGRPGVEEAWALIPKDEAGSVIWTEEMSQAFSACRDLLKLGDKIEARQTFKEVYGKLCMEARTQRRPAKWWPSMGQDPQLRAAAINYALDKRRITLDYAKALLPNHGRTTEEKKLLSGEVIPLAQPQNIRSIMDKILKDAPVHVRRLVNPQEDLKKDMTQEEIAARAELLREQAKELDKT